MYSAPYFTSDAAGERLRIFAHMVRPFGWPDDPRKEGWERLLDEPATGEADDPVEGKTQDLWDLLLAVVRSERFNEGAVAAHAVALTRLANEIRRRLLAARSSEATQEERLRAPALVPFRAKKDARDLRVLDPASGSGHFLLYCFDLLETIYEEAYDDSDIGPALQEEYPDREAYRRAVPGMILRHTLFGIDIDPRATQLTMLTLWLRAQRAYQALGLAASDRPAAGCPNAVVAQPMPGEEDLFEEWVADLHPRVLGQIARVVFQRMRLGGEAGSLLKIEQEIREVIAEAKRQWKAASKQEQLMLWPELRRPKAEQMNLFDLAGVSDGRFWEEAEGRLLEALRDYAARGVEATAGTAFTRRLFAGDAEQGFAFIDLCRRRYDVVLMNPPFGEASKGSKSYIEKAYPRTKNDLYAAFVERGLALLRPRGMLGAITSRTGFFLSSFQKWREEILLGEARPTVVADLGYGVLDTAMVETAAYCLEKQAATGGRR